MVGHLASLLPIGAIAFKVNLLSAVCGAISATLLYRLLARWGLQEEGAASSPSSRLLVTAAAFTPALSYPLWIQSVRAEVYGLQLLLALAMVMAAVRAGVLEARIDPRWAGVSALFCGLNLAVHPLLGLLAAAPVLFLALLSWRALSLRLVAMLASAGLLGFSSYLLLPLRARVHPGHGWGDPDQLDAMLDSLLARSFRQNFSPLTGGMLEHNARTLFGSFLSAAGPGPLFLAVVGAVLLVFQHRRRAFLLIGLLLCNLWSILPQNKVFPQNPDYHGYLELSNLMVWSLAVVPPLQLIARLSGRAAWVGPLVVLVFGSLAAPSILLSLPDADRSRDDLARQFGQAALRGLPPGGYLQTSGNNTMFILQYLQDVERLRPDVTVVSRSLMTHAWYRQRLPFSEAWHRAAAGPVSGFLPLVGDRPLRVELRTPDLSAANALCPAPEPGWGFFDIAPCPRLETALERPPDGGLLKFPGVDQGPESLIVAINAHMFLADYYAARGKAAWASEERALLKKLSSESQGEIVTSP